MASVELTGISKNYGAVEVIRGLNLSVPDGSFTALLGPSGCGKSTLLRMIAGLEEITGGSARIGGTDITHEAPARRGVAMVFQSYALYPHLTVEQNICFSMSLAGESKAVQKQKSAHVAQMLQLDTLMDRRPAQLSGGQRQRVAIGRALVRDPKVFLFDEPLSNLDALLRVQMRLELARLHQDLKTTMIYVTHDQIEAMTMATHVGVLDHGRLVQFGSPREIYEQPVSVYAASRLGQPRINLLPADHFPGAPPRAVTIGLRPEQIRQGEGQEAMVKRVEHLGDQTRLHLTCNSLDLITVTDAHTVLRPGDIIKIQPDRPFYFDAAGARIG